MWRTRFSICNDVQIICTVNEDWFSCGIVPHFRQETNRQTDIDRSIDVDQSINPPTNQPTDRPIKGKYTHATIPKRTNHSLCHVPE